MVVKKVKVNLFICNKCGYEWMRRYSQQYMKLPPLMCPNCKSTQWNKDEYLFKLRKIEKMSDKIYLSDSEIEIIKRQNKRVNNR